MNNEFVLLAFPLIDKYRFPWQLPALFDLDFLGWSVRTGRADSSSCSMAPASDG